MPLKHDAVFIGALCTNFSKPCVLHAHVWLVCCKRASTGLGYPWYGGANQQKTFWKVLEGWKWVERFYHRLGNVAVLSKWHYFKKYFCRKKPVKSESDLSESETALKPSCYM